VVKTLLKGKIFNNLSERSLTVITGGNETSKENLSIWYSSLFIVSDMNRTNSLTELNLLKAAPVFSCTQQIEDNTLTQTEQYVTVVKLDFIISFCPFINKIKSDSLSGEV
jgi:hypothetical protein